MAFMPDGSVLTELQLSASNITRINSGVSGFPGRLLPTEDLL